VNEVRDALARDMHASRNRALLFSFCFAHKNFRALAFGVLFAWGPGRHFSSIHALMKLLVLQDRGKFEERTQHKFSRNFWKRDRHFFSINHIFWFPLRTVGWLKDRLCSPPLHLPIPSVHHTYFIVKFYRYFKKHKKSTQKNSVSLDFWKGLYI